VCSQSPAHLCNFGVIARIFAGMIHCQGSVAVDAPLAEAAVPLQPDPGRESS
jgi:hypothetical protein